jgi:hypothetical protein
MRRIDFRSAEGTRWSTTIKSRSISRLVVSPGSSFLSSVVSSPLSCRRLRIKGDVSNVTDDFGTHLVVCFSLLSLSIIHRLTIVSPPQVHPASGLLLSIPFRSNCGGRRLNQYTINLEIQFQTLPDHDTLPTTFPSLEEDPEMEDRFGTHKTAEPSSLLYPLVTIALPSQTRTKSKV